MAFPVTPLDAIFELYAGRDWQDITADVYLRDGVTITHGRPNESSSAEPGSCQLTLNNRHGKYSPRNPTSPYYGTLGRNSPLRISVRDNQDQFERTVASGWGTTTAGDTWSSTSVGSTSLSVGSGWARHEVNGTLAYALSYLPARLYKDVDVKVKVRVPAGNDIAGGNIEPANIVLRGESVTDYFLVRVKIKPDNTLWLEIRHETSGAVIAPEVLSTQLPLGQPWDLTEFTVRAQIEGQTIRAKAWDHTRTLSGTDPANINPYEPLDWDITGHTGDFYEGQRGWIGIRSGVGTGVTNTPPIVFEYDDLQVTVPRGTWEVADWPVKWDVSGKDVYVPIQASGVLRRLGQGAAPLRSAMFRAMMNPDMTTPLAYWPCEDAADAEYMASAVPGGSPLRFAGGPLSMVQRASFTEFACSAPLSTFGGPLGAFLEGQVPRVSAPDVIHTYALMAVPEAGVSADCQLLNVRTAGSTSSEWMVEATPGGSLRLRIRDWLGADVFLSGNISFDVNGDLCMVVLSLDKNGSNVDWDVTVFKVGSPLPPAQSSGTQAIGLGWPTSVAVGLGGATNGTAFGHVALAVTNDTPFINGTLEDAVNAYTGSAPETHLARMIRLTSDEDIPFAYYGDADDTPLAGAQRPISVVDIVKEGAVADQGWLGECRGAAALHYRSRTSAYNQTGLALDYDAGDISPPFEPVDDDQQTRNDITVKRVGGSSVQVTQDTGRLSVNPPPNGVGRYDTSVEMSLDSDVQLADQAGWQLLLGIVDEARYPSVRVNLAHRPSLIRDVTSLAMGDRVTIANLPVWMPPETVDLIVTGYTEVLGTYSWDVILTCLPGSPYQVIVLDDPNSRIGCHWKTDANGGPIDETDTTFHIGFDFPNGGTSTEVWTTNPAQMPIPIMVGGELMHITAIPSSGPGSADITVTRSVNGVVKSHENGTPVTLARRPTIAL